MPRTTARFVVALLATSLLLAGCGGAAGSGVQAEDVWARPAMAMARGAAAEAQPAGHMAGGMAAPGTGAVFMRLVNNGPEADRLLGGKTSVAETVEIHETAMEGEIMKMRMLPDGLELPAGGEVLLKPGGYHIMLIGLQDDLQPGDTFDLELQLEKAGPLTVKAEVREP